MSHKIQYIHINNDEQKNKLSKKQAIKKRSRTLAVEIPSKEYIRENIALFASSDVQDESIAVLSVGISVVSVDDNYDKAVGRMKASNKIKPVALQIVSVKITNKHAFIDFETYEGVNLSIRMNRVSGFINITGSLNEKSE